MPELSIDPTALVSDLADGELPAEVETDGVCVVYLNPHSGYLCLQAIRGSDRQMLVSTRNPAEVARWPDEASAIQWLAAAGLKPGDLVPVGVGHMRALVWPFETSWRRSVPATWRGALFETVAAGDPPFDPNPNPPAAVLDDDAPLVAALTAPLPVHATGGPKRTKRELAEAVVAAVPNDAKTDVVIPADASTMVERRKPKREPLPREQWPELRKPKPRPADEPLPGQGMLF